MRLNKFLARCGVASRRTSDCLISEGKVSVNGRVADTMGIIINPDKDIVLYDGKKLTLPQEFVYYMLNKPKGYVTTVADQFDRPTVMDLLKDIKVRVFPVGRLDYATEGLLIVTNDGDMSFKLTHPRHDIEKIYHVSIKGNLSKEDIAELEAGMVIDDYKTTGAKVKLLEVNGDISKFAVAIYEGRNRQIRKMFENINKDIVHLRRVQIGRLEIGNLKRGEYRPLTEQEISNLTADSEIPETEKD